MRILIFSELFYPHAGGAELATWLYSKMLSEEGIKVSVLTKQFAGEESVSRLNANLTIYRIPFGVELNGRYDTLLNVPRLLNSSILKLFRECDLVYVPGSWLAAALLAKMYRKPLLLHVHNYALICSLSLMYDPYLNRVERCTTKGFYWHERLKRGSLPKAFASTLADVSLGRLYYGLAQLADAIIFVSEAQYKLVIAYLPQLVRKSYIIPNPLPEDVPFEPLDSVGMAYFGGLDWKKGFRVLWEGVHLLPHHITVDVYLVGTSNRVRVEQLRGVRLYLTPRLSRPEQVNIMRNVSVVAFPSLWPEPFPYVVLETLLAGRRLIASNVGGVPEIVRDMEHGVWLINAGDVKQFILALREALAAHRNGEALKVNRERILAKYNNKISSDTFFCVAKELC